jgi:putative transposase
MSDTRYRRNAGSVYSLVFSPTYRRKVLVGEIADELRSLLYHKAQELDVTMEVLDIMPEPVHLFIESDPTEAPQRLANQFKGYPSRSSRNCAPACLVWGAEAATLVR